MHGTRDDNPRASCRSLLIQSRYADGKLPPLSRPMDTEWPPTHSITEPQMKLRSIGGYCKNYKVLRLELYLIN